MLGVGFFLPLCLFANHLAFIWLWLAVRLLEVIHDEDEDDGEDENAGDEQDTVMMRMMVRML